MEETNQAIQRVSHTHEDILNFLMMNPTTKLGDVARHFGYTAGWLSQVIHSDVFQMRLRERQDLVFNETVLPLREKMQVLAHGVLDKMNETIPFETDVNVLNKVAENLLDRLGFGTKGPSTVINQQNNVTLNNASKDELAEARKLLGKAATVPREYIDGELSPIALPSQGVARVGQTAQIPAFFQSVTETESG